jgi:tRNA G18 (ribose-2'-O)-methylase SpoU
MAYKIRSMQKSGFKGSYYQAHVVKTAKAVGTKGNYQAYDTETKKFKSKEELEEYLNDTYGKYGSVQKTYMEKADGTSVQTGFIVRHKSSQYEDGKNVFYNNQDWYSISEVEENDMTVKVTKSKEKA